MPNAILESINNSNGMTLIKTRDCMVCHKPGELTVPTSEFEAWNFGQGEFIQDAMPSVSAGDRELLLSGTHDACWDEMWAGDEDDE